MIREIFATISHYKCHINCLLLAFLCRVISGWATYTNRKPV